MRAGVPRNSHEVPRRLLDGSHPQGHRERRARGPGERRPASDRSL